MKKLKNCRDCVALVEVRAMNERLLEFIRGCITLGGQQRGEIESQRKTLLEIAAAFNGWANAGTRPVDALEQIGRALGVPF